MIEIFKKLSKRELRLVTILLSIILLYGIYIIVFAPSISKLENKENELLDLKEQKIKLNNEIVYFNKLKYNYQSYNYDDLLIQFPNEGKVPEIILWIEKIFEEPNISHLNVSLLRQEEEKRYLQLTLNFTGQYNKVQDLINKIETNERLTIIESTSLSEGTSNLITTNLVIKIYGQDFTDISEKEYEFNNINIFRKE